MNTSHDIFHKLEQIAAQHPNRRIHSVVADLRAQQVAEQLRAAPKDYAVNVGQGDYVEIEPTRNEWSFFGWMMGVRK